MIRRHLPWLALLVSLATAVLLLFGPLWATAEGENPLTRPRTPDWETITALSVPTVVVLAAVVLAILGRRWPVLGGLVLLATVALVLAAPGSHLVWWAPSLLIVAGAWVWGLVGPSATSSLAGTRTRDPRAN